MTSIHYLAYGSNLYPPRLLARIRPLGFRGIVELAGWSLVFHKKSTDGSAKCDLVRDPGRSAYGAVYAMSPAQKKTLDGIEGLGRGYDLHWLELDGFGRCFMYRADPAFTDPRLLPYDWYKALVLAGARHHGLPAAYIAALEAVRSQPDPDAERRFGHLALLGSADDKSR